MQRMTQLCVFLIGVFIVNPSAVYADGCRVISRGSYSYSYPTVNYVPSFVTPSYTAQNTYYPQTILPLAVQTLYQVAPDAAQAQINKITAKEAAKEALEEYEKRTLTRNPPPQSPPVNPLPSEKNGGEIRQEQPNTDPLAGVPLKGVLNAPPSLPPGNVQAIFNARCVKCHGEGSKSYDLTNVALLPQHVREEIVSTTHREEGVKAMPPNLKDKLTVAENREIRRWAYSLSK